MTDPAKTGLGTALWRGATRRCPRCGTGGLFKHWTNLAQQCPECDLHFERVEGYWSGSMALNLIVTEGVFLVTLIGVMVLTWPDVPWVLLLVVTVALSVVVPIVFHPISRTLWMAAERHYTDPDDPPRPHSPIR